MSYLLLACPNCRAPYKIPSERARTNVTCRACGHTWIPVQAEASQSGPGAPGQEPPASVPGAGAGAAVAPPSSPADPPPASAGAVARPGPAQAPAKAAHDAATPKQKPAPPAKPPQPTDAAKEMAQVVRDERPDPLVGTTINGFKIQGRIGSGGFGVVYRAFDKNLERSVAIKMLPPKLAKAGQGLMDRFLREARSAAKLGHPNIVTIHQICAYKETFYIVMELIDGGALYEFLQVQKRFGPGEATRIIRAAAEGLGHAHRRGIIHRDIKPGNIMMANDGQVKVSDFGLARDVLQGRDIVGEGHCLGTPRYMSPEQALGDQPTAASDLYSLAATYYALLTGRAPFDGASDREIMKKQVTDAVPDPRQFVSGLPVAAFRFFEKAMAKQPEDRYQTADEFVAALDRLDFGQSDAAALTPQSLAAQIGPISPEDRGTHLTQTLDRAVQRSVRTSRTPIGEHVLDGALSRRTPAGGISWKVWALIGFGLLVVLTAAVVTAILLARNRDTTRPAGQPSVVKGLPAVTPVPTQAVTPTPTKPAVALPTPTPAPPGTLPVRTTTPAAKSTSTGDTVRPAPRPAKTDGPDLEQLAQEALAEVKKEESNPQTAKFELARMYQENVVNIYPGTKAAAEARAAIKRLQNEDEFKPAPLQE